LSARVGRTPLQQKRNARLSWRKKEVCRSVPCGTRGATLEKESRAGTPPPQTPERKASNAASRTVNRPSLTGPPAAENVIGNVERPGHNIKGIRKGQARFRKNTAKKKTIRTISRNVQIVNQKRMGVGGKGKRRGKGFLRNEEADFQKKRSQ